MLNPRILIILMIISAIVLMGGILNKSGFVGKISELWSITKLKLGGYKDLARAMYYANVDEGVTSFLVTDLSGQKHLYTITDITRGIYNRDSLWATITEASTDEARNERFMLWDDSEYSSNCSDLRFCGSIEPGTRKRLRVIKIDPELSSIPRSLRIRQPNKL